MPRPLQCREIDRRFQQRTRWPARIQGTVEAGVARMPTTHQGRHLAGVQPRDHGSSFQFTAGIDLLENTGGAGLELPLQQRVEGSEDTEALCREVLLPILHL